MKRLLFFLFLINDNLIILAQKGHIRPEDVADIEELEKMAHHTTSSGDSSNYALVILVLLAIVVIVFKIALNSSDKKDINQRIAYFTTNEINAYQTATKAIDAKSNFKNCKDYFEMENGVVLIPSGAKCIIMEYINENKSYVKVKFDRYPYPLYLQRCWLRKE